VVSLLFIAPGVQTMALGFLLWSPVIALQWRRRRVEQSAT
jgi:UPF0716 family protein affecting phage T7 exclusion